MKSIKITKAGTYADPKVSLPHLVVKEGDVVPVREQMADIMCGEYHAAELIDESVEETSDTPDDETEGEDQTDDPIQALVDAHGKKVLAAACAEADLDTDGNKTELATRLVESGITEIVTE